MKEDGIVEDVKLNRGITEEVSTCLNTNEHGKVENGVPYKTGMINGPTRSLKTKMFFSFKLLIYELQIKG